MNKPNHASDLEKIYFRLQQDEDKYPPTPWESMWGRRIENSIFEIDSIPFYAMNVSPGDKIKAKLVDGRYEYLTTVSPSGNSVFRVYVYDASKIMSARERFRRLGIQSELAEGKLFAIEIPEQVNIEPVLELLMQGQDADEWDIEEGSLRHPLPD